MARGGLSSQDGHCDRTTGDVVADARSGPIWIFMAEHYLGQVCRLIPYGGRIPISSFITAVRHLGPRSDRTRWMLKSRGMRDRRWCRSGGLALLNRNRFDRIGFYGRRRNNRIYRTARNSIIAWWKCNSSWQHIKLQTLAGITLTEFVRDLVKDISHSPVHTFLTSSLNFLWSFKCQLETIHGTEIGGLQSYGTRW